MLLAPSCYAWLMLDGHIWPSKQALFIRLLPHSAVSLSPLLPHLVYQGTVEKRPRCCLVQAVAVLSSTFCCHHTKPIHLLLTLFLPFALQLFLMHRCGQCRRGHILWVLLTHSSSPRAPLPLAPWCRGSNPAHGSFQLQETQPRQTIPDEGTWAGGILLISKPCSKKGAGNSIQGRKGVRPGNTDKGGCEIGAEKKQNHSFIFPCKS